eukprot:9336430-Alexandrium_andersonii.AAC.1
MPVFSRRQWARPSGAVNSAQRGTTKALTSLRQRSGMRRQAMISPSHVGASRSNALLWSISRATRTCGPYGGAFCQ